MNSGTTRITPPVEASYERHITRRWGNRYRCTTCYARGVDRAPHYMCHHCGRLFCEECSSKLRPPLSWFFQHQELSALQARGARRWVGDAWWQEASHCRECVHYVPRYPSWILLMTGIAFLLILFLYLTGASTAIITVLPALVFVAGMGIAFAWRTWDATSRQQRFFPADGEPPIIELEERIEADATLDNGKYMEVLRDRSPSGFLRATVRITEEDRRQLEQYEHHLHLTENTLSSVPVTAGAVVLEGIQRVAHNDMRWNERGEWLVHPDTPAWTGQRSRRWQFKAPLAQWSALWVPNNTEPKVFSFEYLIDWWVWRQTFKMPFPVQIRASFPEQGDRRTVVLEVALTGSVAHLGNPFIRQIMLQRGEGLPSFRLLPVQGQKMEGDSPDRVAIQDLKLNENRVGLIQLQFDEPVDVSRPVWLNGIAMMGAVGSTLSQMEIKGYYDAFGRLSRPTRQEVRAVAILNFRLNLASLPYQTRTAAIEETTLTGISAERDDEIVEYLERETEVVYANEQVQPIPLNAPQKIALPPIREVLGRWHDSTLAVPLVYRVKITPTPSGTIVKIEVEQSDDGTPTRAATPKTVAKEIKDQLLAALKKAAPEPSLLGKLRK